MKARIGMIAFMAMLLSATNVVAKDLRTVIFKVEQLCCEKCEAKVKKNIPFEKGVKGLKCDIPTQTVTVTYDADKTNIEKLQKGFAKFEYTAEVIKEEKKEAK
ncbi:MAG: cation transporter [Bacteroides sp.]|nr:cation transporter [Bacteroides sp.]